MSKLRNHPCFIEIEAEEAEVNDPAVAAMINTTEEGKKVARAGNNKYWGVFQRLSDEDIASKNDPLFEWIEKNIEYIKQDRQVAC